MSSWDFLSDAFIREDLSTKDANASLKIVFWSIMFCIFLLFAAVSV